MRWNYRQGGSWNIPTVKRRANGQWVDIAGSGGGGGGGGGGIENPPHNIIGEAMPSEEWDRERNGTTIDASSYPSLQEAADALSEGDTLHIPAGTYTERITIPQTNHVTYEGEGSGTSGTIIEVPDANEDYGTGVQSEYSLSNTTMASPSPSQGDTTIQVGDASGFSADDWIAVLTDTDYKGFTGSELGRTYTYTPIIEIHQVDSVDTSTDEIHIKSRNPITQPNHGDNTTEVSLVGFHATDVRFTNIRFENPSTYTVRGSLRCDALLRPWIDNVGCYHYGGQHTSFWMGHCVQGRVKDSYFSDGDNYAFQVSGGSTHIYVSNCGGEEDDRYIFASTGWSSYGPRYNIYMRELVGGKNSNLFHQTVVNTHWGSENVVFENVESYGGQYVGRCRSNDNNFVNLDMYAEDGTGGIVRFDNRPTDCTIENATMHDPDEYSSFIFNFDIDDSGSEMGAYNMYFDNIAADTTDYMIRIRGDTLEVDGLEVWNSTKGGSLYDVDAFLDEGQYDSSRMSDFIIEGEDPNDHL